MAKGEGFNSKIGAVAAAAGSAVGLGNIWRFPYVVGENGGAAFLLLYIFFMVLIAMPVLLGEFSIGRMTGKPVIKAFRQLAPGSNWYLIGVSGVVCAFLILGFYNVVAGWTVYYSYLAVTGALNGLSPAEVSATFTHAQTDPTISSFWMIVTLSATGYVVARGVNKGIERYSKILMPLLLVLILIVCVRSLTLDSEMKGITFLLSPDFSKISVESCIEALGQAFFSLSLGMGTMATYGAYIQKNQNLPKTAVDVAMVDFLIAFLAGLMIFPCAFAFGVNPGSGPGLVFVTLPNVFNQMPAGQLMSIMFFVLLVVAAVTSSISMLEVVVTNVMSRFNWGRRKATVLSLVSIVFLGVGCAAWPAMLNAFDAVSANIMMPLGGLFIILFVSYGLDKEALRAELEAHGKRFRLFSVYYFLAKWVVPIAVAFIFVSRMVQWLG